ncbi:MAG: Dabb family protein [Verrucomicrobiota bacterium]
MKTVFFGTLLLSLFFGVGLGSVMAGDGDYRHVVLFQFKEDATPAAIAGIEQAFVALEDKIDTIEDLEWGTNVSPEGLNEGFTHCFLVTFEDRAGLDVYIPHPAHKEFVAMLKPHLEKVLVVDYVAQDD